MDGRILYVYFYVFIIFFKGSGFEDVLGFIVCCMFYVIFVSCKIVYKMNFSENYSFWFVGGRVILLRGVFCKVTEEVRG